MSTDTAPYPRVRWYNSLILRVLILCVVLLLCLLGSVYQISAHYVHEVVREMTTQAQGIADTLTVYLEQHEGADLTDAEQRMMELYEETKIKIDPYTEAVPINSFALDRNEKGELVKVAQVLIPTDKGKMLLTARVTIVPKTEVLRVFTNKYLAALAAVFVITLGLMLYFIAKMLRPLTELSESCAQISSGNLKDVATRKSYGEILALEHTFNRMVSSLREKEQIEANLRQAQRLSAIGNLAAGVAHDIRNPLNAIKLLSSHAIDTLGDVPDAAPARKQIQTIRNEVNRLEDIVSGFLSLAKERELQPEPTRIDSILEECARLVKKDAETRGIRLVVELRAGDTSLMVDPKAVTRAVLNVLFNALDACPAGGRVRLFSRVTDRSCEIEIRDDGPGMSKETAERAFEPYFTTKSTGTGLGLSITRGVIEEHGGSIALSSVENQGCQVLIALPLETRPL